MTRQTTGSAIVVVLCIAVSLVYGEPRGKGKPETKGKSEHGKSTPGGEWSEPQHHSGQSAGQASRSNQKPAGKGATADAAATSRKSPQTSGAERAAAADKDKSSQPSGAQGAAAGAAAENRKSPQTSGAQGAAVGAAAENRNSPKYSAAQGAAAGAAAENRNSPKYSGAQGAAEGAAAENRNSPKYTGAQGAVVGADAVRTSFSDPNLYSRNWYGAHPGVWAPSAWAAGAAWTQTNWQSVAGYNGTTSTPVSYGYGSNVTAQQGNVMVNGQSVGTTAEFSQQAADLANAGTAGDADASGDWLPLGVFAMVRHEQETPNLILQFAINKQGILRGNYTDEASEKTQAIHGSVDSDTQRAAWMVGGNKTTIMEAGLSNMTSGEAPALTHKGGKTDHWLLVRLDQPAKN